jgi:hypothetical protein
MFLLLNTMQNVAWRAPRIGELGEVESDDMSEKIHSALRGPLRIADPAKFACRHVDMPVGIVPVDQGYQLAAIREDRIYYMEQFLFIFLKDVYNPDDIAAHEAYLLVRDPRYYRTLHITTTTTAVAVGKDKEEMY